MLWVSAFEILCHPEGEGQKIKISMILDLINRINWRNKKLSGQRFRYRFPKNNTMPINLPSKLYSFLYKARNDFAHGSRITPLSQYGGKNKRYKPLILVAPVLYVMVLKEKIRECGISFPTVGDSVESPFIKLQKDRQEDYEKALLVSFTEGYKGDT